MGSAVMGDSWRREEKVLATPRAAERVAEIEE
jgi:hypothetical protein